MNKIRVYWSWERTFKKWYTGDRMKLHPELTENYIALYDFGPLTIAIRKGGSS
jgi:hypothetical protein